jgi:hypothetical protein
VVAEVAMQRLVVVGGAGVLGPQLDLVQVQVARAEVALGGVDEVGVERKAVERPPVEREPRESGELAARQPGVGGRVGEVGVGVRDVARVRP